MWYSKPLFTSPLFHHRLEFVKINKKIKYFLYHIVFPIKYKIKKPEKPGTFSLCEENNKDQGGEAKVKQKKLYHKPIGYRFIFHVIHSTADL